MTITIRAGRPGYGKTYTATQDIIEKLKAGRRVYSNWPVMTTDGRYSTLVWEPWMIQEQIFDADVYIDEAYRDYDSTEKDSVDTDTHTFFATNRHNDVNGVLIAQNVARIAKKIREIAEYEYVKKREIPFLLWLPYCLIVRTLMAHGINPMGYKKPPRAKFPRPLWFTIYTYENEEKAQKGEISQCEYVTRRLFEYETATAYDTHYFRKAGDAPFESVTWYDHIENMIPVPDRNPTKRFEQFRDFDIFEPSKKPPFPLEPQQMNAKAISCQSPPMSPQLSEILKIIKQKQSTLGENGRKIDQKSPSV